MTSMDLFALSWLCSFVCIVFSMWKDKQTITLLGLLLIAIICAIPFFNLFIAYSVVIEHRQLLKKDSS